jgi:hypothetical protein
VTTPECSDCRGDPSGEADGLEKVQGRGNPSPELRWAAARSSRGCFRRPGAQTETKRCQRGTRRQRNRGSAGRDRGGDRGSPAIGDAHDRQWQRGESWFWQPGGEVARVSGRVESVDGGD